MRLNYEDVRVRMLNGKVSFDLQMSEGFQIWLKILEQGKVFVKPRPEHLQLLRLGCFVAYSLY